MQLTGGSKQHKLLSCVRLVFIWFYRTRRKRSPSEVKRFKEAIKEKVDENNDKTETETETSDSYEGSDNNGHDVDDSDSDEDDDDYESEEEDED